MIEEFNSYRSKMNDRIMETANTNIKRFFALDFVFIFGISLLI